MTKKEIQLEYIEKFLSAIESDKKMVMSYIAFALAIMVFSLKEIALTQNRITDQLLIIVSWKRVLFLISMLNFGISSFSFFSYYRKLHLRIYQITRKIRTDIENFEDDNLKFWQTNGWLFQIGLIFFWCAVVLYLVFFSSIII